MNRVLLLILVAGATFLIILFAVKPELIGDIWLWLVGLSGVIIKAFQSLIAYVKKMFSGNSEQTDDNEPSPENNTVAPSNSNRSVAAKDEKAFDGITLRLLRYSDDGETTIGMLTINNKFYCYTLEDTFHEEKIPKETRIPAGTYIIDYLREETPSTKKMRELYNEWFMYHLELKNVPNFNYVYIHNGGTHNDTEGCILVSDSLNVSSDKTFLSNSRETFRRLYIYLSEQLNNSIPVRIIIHDENWLNSLK